MSEFSIPRTCKAGVMHNEGPDFYVKVEEVEVPTPGPDEVLLKLNITGLCYSDLHYMMGDLSALPKMSACGVRSPGHEGAGVVVKIGEKVTNFKVGDRGGIKPLWSTCGACVHCWGGLETHCAKGIFTGLGCPGTYQQYIVSPARYLTPIPKEVSDEVAAPLMCSAATMVQSLEASRMKPGQWAVFPGGGGGVGIQGVQLAKAMGYRPIAIDTGADKRELCLKLGAEAFIDFKETSNVAAEVVKLADGIGAHGVFVTAPQAYKDAISYVGNRIGASVMCVGLPPTGTVLLGTDPSQYVLQKLTISGTVVGSMMDTEKALDFARRGMLKPIYEKWPIDKLPEALEKLKLGKVAGRCIIDFNM